MTILVKTFLSGRVRCVDVSCESSLNTIPCHLLKNFISRSENISESQFKIVYNGCYVKDDHSIPDGSTVHILLSLPGGKGGFGSMLRAIGAQIEKTTNREACRDLSGRRLRDINEEQRLKRWISKQADRERDKARRRKEKLERLRSSPKHYFQDFSYDKQRSELPDRIDSALTQGLQTTSNSGECSQKRKCKASEQPRKKRCMWLGVDDIDDSGSDNNNEDSSPKHPLSEVEVIDISSSSAESNSQEASTSSYHGSEIVAVDSQTSNSESAKDDDNSIKKDASCEDNSNLPQSSSSSNIENGNEDETAAGSSKSGFTWNYNFMKKSTPVVDNDESEENSTSDTSNSSGSSEESEGEEPESLEIPKPSKEVHSNAQVMDDSCPSTSQNKDAPKKSSTLLSQLPLPSSQDDTKKSVNLTPETLNLLAFQSAKNLEELGLEFLKSALMALGMKCGGTLQQRAERLWSVRGIEHSKIPTSLLAKSSTIKIK